MGSDHSSVTSCKPLRHQKVFTLAYDKDATTNVPGHNLHDHILAGPDTDDP